MSKKIFLGYKMRRLREGRGLTQLALSRLLDISPSYLNQIENNQRPVTLPVLLKTAQAFDIDITQLVEDDQARLLSDLKEALSDSLFVGAPPGTTELRNAIAASPELSRRVLTLHQAYRDLQDRTQALADRLSDQDRTGALSGAQFPYEEVRDFFHFRNNYFGPLDEAAENLWSEEGFHSSDLQTDLMNCLKKRHDVRVTLLPDEDEQPPMRQFDPGSGTLALSAQMDSSSRIFHMGHQLALLEHGGLIEAMIAEAGLSGEDARSICRVGLANYFAGALLMPYRRFAHQARLVRHDIEILQNRFGASFEQVCHRLSTLQRPNARGVPFYFLRVDIAGNITKRHSATRFHFARFGGACPLWNLHEAFGQPGKILVQHARMPDGTTYLCMARSVSKPGGAYLRPTRQFAIGLGCETAYADELVYAAGINTDDPSVAVPIGVNCRICERTDCQQRAFPPIGATLRVDDRRRSFVPYLFDRPSLISGEGGLAPGQRGA